MKPTKKDLAERLATLNGVGNMRAGYVKSYMKRTRAELLQNVAAAEGTHVRTPDEDD